MKYLRLKNKLEKIYEEVFNLSKPANVEADCLQTLKISEPYEKIIA